MKKMNNDENDDLQIIDEKDEIEKDEDEDKAAYEI
jgi:hypothetical protein